MAYVQGLKMGEKCTPSLMKSVMHFRGEEINKRSAFDGYYFIISYLRWAGWAVGQFDDLLSKLANFSAQPSIQRWPGWAEKYF